MRRFFVLGDPVSHSRSPVIHRAAFRALGIDAVYEARQVDTEGMSRVADQIRRGEVSGANITMPHKEVAFRLADRVEGEAVAARSVNTWAMEDGRLIGYSTDIPAIRRVWRRRALPEGPALILGSGGAAAAALVALTGQPVYLSARRTDTALALAERIAPHTHVISWGRAVEAVVVNCTPLGMRGEALPTEVTEHATGLFEMAYGSEETPATRWARDHLLPVADGLDLLVDQAALSFEIWHGVEAPLQVMEAAARNS